jgi:hypothetical protein
VGCRAPLPTDSEMFCELFKLMTPAHLTLRRSGTQCQREGLPNGTPQRCPGCTAGRSRSLDCVKAAAVPCSKCGKADHDGRVGELVSEDELLHPQSRCRDLPQISQAKFNRFRRTPPGFTTSELAGEWASPSVARSPAHLRPRIRFLFLIIGSRLCSTPLTFFQVVLSGPRLAAGVISPLRFTNPSSPSD